MLPGSCGGLLFRQDAATLPLSLLFGGLASLVTHVIGVLRCDRRHDTGLYCLRRSDMSVGLAYTATVVVAYMVSVPTSQKVHGEVRPVVSNPAYLAVGALATVCFVLSCVAFDMGRTRACVLWTVPMPLLGCLFCLALEPGPGTALAGLFVGSLCAMTTLLMGLLPGPHGERSNLEKLRRAHILTFLGHAGLVGLTALGAAAWAVVTQ